MDYLASEVRLTQHRGGDDLLSAGLGLAGLAGAASRIDNPLEPTSAELRRRAIQTSWKGIADLGPLGGYGNVYGGVPDVPGREFSVFARLPEAKSPFRVLLQAPDHFDAGKRCLLVAPSSGSRGVYGAISLAGAFGLPRGCAVVYTDKGTGSGYFDTDDGTGVTLDGRRAKSGSAQLEFEPDNARAGVGVAVKHVHSGDNPEADWGRHVLTAARFGLVMLNRAYPDQAPFTKANTHIIAAGLSNGGGAVLQAAGLDDDNLLDGVMAMEPNIHVPGHGRALYGYATEAALLMPCALTDPRFATVPFARSGGVVPPVWLGRCQRLHDAGILSSDRLPAQAREALERLHDSGWTDPVIATAASTTVFDVWRAVSAAYASAYLGRGVGHMPCGFSYHSLADNGLPGPTDEALRQTWWADASGVPPGNGIGLVGGTDMSVDPSFPGLECLRELWTGDSADTHKLHTSVEAVSARMPRKSLPIWVVHGADDGLIPTVFTSEPYVAWLRENGREPRYWKIPHAQHFDAFLVLPGFGDVHTPLMPFAYRALDAMMAHVVAGEALPDPPAPKVQMRGPGALTSAMLDLPD